MNTALRRELLDKENKKPIPMTNAEGRTLHFIQIFATEREGTVFCILRPAEPVRGLGEQAAVAFSVQEDGRLAAVRDRALSEEIFRAYYAALRGKEG